MRVPPHTAFPSRYPACAGWRARARGLPPAAAPTAHARDRGPARDFVTEPLARNGYTRASMGTSDLTPEEKADQKRRALFGVLEVLAEQEDPSAAMRALAAAVRGLFPFDAFYLAGGRKGARYATQYTFMGDDLVPLMSSEIVERAKMHLLNDVRATGETRVTGRVEDLIDYPLAFEALKEHGIESLLLHPLEAHGDWEGGLAFCRRGKHAFDNVDREGLAMVADVVAAAAAAHWRAEEARQAHARMTAHAAYLREELDEAAMFQGIVAQSPGMREVVKAIETVGPTDSPVLISGETGTGKELVSRAVHAVSERASKPFVKMNCAALPEAVAESELFGHARGAFTGAHAVRRGRFEVADGGTLFLDELGELSLKVQGSLLNVVEYGTYERVGEDKTRSADVRIVAATNRDLEQSIELAEFRSDLYYRLNIFPIRIPPLRERLDDIPPLVTHMLPLLCKKLKRDVPQVREEDLEALMKHPWPGNVRQLQAVLERSLIISRGPVLEIEVPPLPRGEEAPQEGILTQEQMREREKRNLEAALEETGGQLYGDGGAAALLGMKPTTLASRLKALGIERPGKA